MTLMRSIVGTWTLIGETAVDSAGEPGALFYGDVPVGCATFTAAGRVAAVLTDGRMNDVSEPRPLTAFCGRYSFDGTLIVMHVDGATRPPMLAEPQVRMVRFEGDAMILTATAADGSTRSFIWRQLG
jgi:hypothetical protein